MPDTNISLGAAFLAGVLSFLSPCVLPLVPVYFSYLTGISVPEAARHEGALFSLPVFTNALVFIFGFTLVFVALGLTAGSSGKLLYHHQSLLRWFSGVLIIFFGMHIAGFLRLDMLLREKRICFTPGKAGPANSLLMGMAFSTGWTPCTGPILASILLLAGNSFSMTTGAILLTAYSLGLGLPFLTAAVFIGSVSRLLKQYQKTLRIMAIAGGWMIVILGLLIMTNSLNSLTGLLP